MPTTKSIHWQRLHSPDMTTDERTAFFHLLSELGRHVHVKPIILKLLLNQIEEDMDRRKAERHV